MEDNFIAFENRLVKVYKHLHKQATRMGISCYRLYDHDMPQFPICIEKYEGQVYVAEYKRQHGFDDESHQYWLNRSVQVISKVLDIPVPHIHIKTRQRKEGRQGQYQKTAEDKHEYLVQEDGLSFIVNLTDYLDTGLFLDHRITRNRVREQCTNMRVLNLFCYTGSFSVYATAGGASQVVSVDLSNTYIQWTKRNMEANGFVDDNAYLFYAVDALDYLKHIKPSSFDIIILDPPTFSNSKKMEGFLDIQRDHVWLVNQCLYGLTANGILYFSNNQHNFKLDSGAIKATTIKDITKATTPFDFAGKLKRWCYEMRK